MEIGEFLRLDLGGVHMKVAAFGQTRKVLEELDQKLFGEKDARRRAEVDKLLGACNGCKMRMWESRVHTSGFTGEPTSVDVLCRAIDDGKTWNKSMPASNDVCEHKLAYRQRQADIRERARKSTEPRPPGVERRSKGRPSFIPAHLVESHPE